MTTSTGDAPTTSSDPVVPDSALAFVTEQISLIFGGALLGFAQWAWGEFNRNGGDIAPIIAALRATPEYKARFPGMDELRRKGRPVDEKTYLTLEREFAQTARLFDLPAGFYDGPEDFGRLISGEVSPLEYKRRLEAWQAYERESRDPEFDREVRAQFAAAGLVPNDGDFLAALIDPGRALSAIERRLEAGRVSAEAARSGFGSLTIDEGLSLADQGVTQDQARQGFGVLSDSRELFAGLPGEEGADSIGREAQITAAFTGDAASRRRIERQRSRRLGEFSGGGGAALGRDGLAGIGAG